MLLLLSTGFILGSGITLALSYLYFKYKIFEPYKTAVTETITLSEGNFEEQGKIIKKQDAIIEEMQRYIDNRKDIIDSLGDNWGCFYYEDLGVK